MRQFAVSTLVLCAMLAVNTSYAGWGDILESVKKSGADLLQQPTKSTSNINAGDTSLSSETLINGLRESLIVGSERAIKLISVDGGYLNDPLIQVPLPAGLDKLAGPMRNLGMGKQVDQFMQSINRAAERAAPMATDILVDNIRSMSFEDARNIYEGADDAATSFFREKAGPQIAALFKPEVNSALNTVGATRYYSDLAEKAAKLPIIGKQVDGDLTTHVTNAALDGLFLKIAAQEKLIREDPAAQATDLLKQLWGN